MSKSKTETAKEAINLYNDLKSEADTESKLALLTMDQGYEPEYEPELKLLVKLKLIKVVHRHCNSGLTTLMIRLR